MPRRSPVLVLLVLLILAMAPELWAEEAVPGHFFFQEPADIGENGKLREPGERIPVFLIHGFLKDDLNHEPNIHVVFSFLHNLWVKQVNRKKDPFGHVFPVHYRYRPDKSYADLGREFARNVEETFGDVPCILLAHSAGATIARYAADAGLSVMAVVGLSPAYGGSPGASMMYANKKIMEDGRVNEDHFRVIQKTLREIGVPDACARSLAWDNSDGGFTKEEIEKYGLVVQDPHPPFGFDRFDHYGILERFVAPFAGLDFLSNSKSQKKTDRELEWEMLGSFNPKWKHSDGVVIPYPKTEADSKTKVWVRTYKGIGHREIFIDREVLERAWGQVQSTARELLGVEPEEDPLVEDPKPPPVKDPPEEPTEVEANPPLPTELASLDSDLGLDEEIELGSEGNLLDDLPFPEDGDGGWAPEDGKSEEVVPEFQPPAREQKAPLPQVPSSVPDSEIRRVLATGLLPGREHRDTRSWLRMTVPPADSGWGP